MDPVADANIVFAALVKDGTNIDLFLELEIRLFAPEFLLTEISKHKEELLKKTKRTEEEFDEIFGLLRQRVTIIPKEEFDSLLEKAHSICPDSDDAL